MGSYRIYLLVAVVPYVVVLVLFHIQLHISDQIEVRRPARPERKEYDKYESLEALNMSEMLELRGVVGTVTDKRLINHSVSYHSMSFLANQHSQRVSLNLEDRNNIENSSRFLHFGGGYIFSAHLDTRASMEPFVRVIALLKASHQPKLFCHFFQRRFPDDSSNQINWDIFSRGSVSEPVSQYEMCENHNKEYGGWILSCKVPSIFAKINKFPHNMAISKGSAFNWRHSGYVNISVLSNVYADINPDKQNRNTSFGICVPPLFGHIPSTTLVEFVELSRLLGANHVFFYVYQVTSAIEQVLKYYQDRGVVTVIPWVIPVREKQVWYHGQLLAINDCLYRTMNRFSYVVFNDIDEFLVPHQHVSWPEMMHALMDTTGTSRNNQTKCGYLFQSAFFDPLVNGNNKILYDLESDLRTKTFSKVRSKIMVQPLMVFELGIHHISRPLVQNVTYDEVDPSVGFIHHYRKCVMDFDTQMKCHIYTRDESIYSFIPSLRHNVHEKLWDLKEISNNARLEERYSSR